MNLAPVVHVEGGKVGTVDLMGLAAPAMTKASARAYAFIRHKREWLPTLPRVSGYSRHVIK